MIARLSLPKGLAWPAEPQWGNFVEVFHKSPLWKWTVNTMIYAGLATLGVVLSSIPVAYALAILQLEATGQARGGVEDAQAGIDPIRRRVKRRIEAHGPAVPIALIPRTRHQWRRSLENECTDCVCARPDSDTTSGALKLLESSI